MRGNYTKARLIPKALLLLGDNLPLKSLLLATEKRAEITEQMLSFEEEWKEAEDTLKNLQLGGMAKN